MAAEDLYVGPADVYAAPVGTAFPALDAAPGASWVLLGTQGSRNISEDGVIVRRNVDTSLIMALGTTMPRKAAVTSAGVEVEFTIMDQTAEQLAFAFGALPEDVVSVGAGAGTIGYDTLDIPTAPVPVERAILVRWTDPTSGPCQFEIKRAIQMGSAEMTFSKEDALSATHLWTTLEPASGAAVTFRQQTAAALPS